GYAIDCEGNDLLVESNLSLDLLDRIEALDALDPNNPILVNGSGEVCLTLARSAGGPSVEVERMEAPAPTFLQRVLEGTLLQDVIDECIQPLITFIRDRFSDPAGQKLVGPGKRNLTAFLNLAIQVANPASGRFVFISAKEDQLLRDFYNGLRAILQSQTFCAMFEKARPLPAYPFDDPSYTTLFGKGLHTRLRLRPGTDLAYTAGANDRIHVYDLSAEEMVAELIFPGGAGVVVQDLAFSQNGNDLYAVATLGQDTLFAVADISGSTHTFRPVTVMKSVQLVTLATAPTITADVYAIGRGTGFFEFNPDNPPATPQARYAFNATGHLVIEENTTTAYAGARSSGTPDRYDAIQQLALRATDMDAIPLIDPVTGGQRSGEDDLAIVVTRRRLIKLYVVTDSPSSTLSKELLVFDLTRGNRTPIAAVDIENTGIKLAPHENRILFLAYEGANRVGLLDADTDTLVEVPNAPGDEFRLSAQVSPVALTVSAQRKSIVVLNLVSDTITLIPLAALAPDVQRELAQQLGPYRDAMLGAFSDLLGGFLQYLKDCICDHFLVNCPQCTEDDKVYLACVRIQAGEVFRVCNFSKRKYVKTFPTVEYWLSAIPIIPLVRELIAQACCAVLPDIFSRFQPSASISGNRFDAKALRQGAIASRQINFGSFMQSAMSRLSLGSTLAGDWVKTIPVQPAAMTKRTVVQSDVVGQRVDVVTNRLGSAGVIIAGTARYDAATGPANLLKMAGAPTRIPEGTPVILYHDDDGVVRYYEKAARAGTTTPAVMVPGDDAVRLRAELEHMRGTIDTLRIEVDRLSRLQPPR
ncbi:MAG: YncE family protein, partial [Longimicrobiales bacterium]